MNTYIWVGLILSSLNVICGLLLLIAVDEWPIKSARSKWWCGRQIVLSAAFALWAAKLLFFP